MEKFFYSKIKKVFRYLFAVVVWSIGLRGPVGSFAQSSTFDTDNQRYFALIHLNLSQDDDYGLEVIRQAASAGMNSIVLTVHWDKVYKDSPTGPGNWYRTDNEIKLATQLGMKVGIRVFLGRNRRFLSGFWTEAESAKDLYQNPAREIYDSNIFTFLHQPSVDKGVTFVREVTERYKYLVKDKKMLYVSVVTSPTQEAGYHLLNIPPQGEYKEIYHSIFDYSDFYKKGFRKWLQEKYKKIIRLNALWGADYKTFEAIDPPATPWDVKESFFGRRGKDWYIYRHIVLKGFNDLMIRTVKAVDKEIPYVLEYGSVTDDASSLRGTLAFRDLSEQADGIKVHDSDQYDHRWTMDVVRSNARSNQWVMNEVYYGDYLPKSEFYEQIDESFENGANLVAFVLSTPGHVAAVRDVLSNSASKWLSTPVVPIVPKDTVSYLLSKAVDKGVNSTGAYDTWKKLARGDRGPRPVYVALNEDLLSTDYWKAAENTAPYLLNPIPMQIIAISRNFTYALPLDTFGDYDGNIVRMEIPNLPAWLQYESGQLKGTPVALGDTRLLVRGIDDEGGVTEAYFTIRVDTRENANKPPTVKRNLTKVSAAVNKEFNFTLPKDLFSDQDGKITTIEVGQLPNWLTYQDGQFKGFPTKSGDYRITLKAYDDLNAFVETFFTIQVVEPQYLNNTPYVQNTLPVRFAKVNEFFRYTLPTNIFGDSDGYITLVTAQDLPSWLTFSLNEFSGTPPAEGQFRVVVRAFDNGGGYVDTPLLIRVEIPQLSFDLVKSGQVGDRQRILTLTEGQVLLAGNLPSYLNIYAYGNFDFDRVDFYLTGPYKRTGIATKLPYALFGEEGGFAPYVGGYTLTATALKQDSVVLTNSIRFSIAPGDSIQPNRTLDEWTGYPNPFQNVFNIALPESSSAQAYTYSVVSINGQRIPVPELWITRFGKIAQIDLSSLTIAPGIYFIRIESQGDYLRQFKVIKQ